MTSKYKRHKLNPCQHRVLFFSHCFSWIIHTRVCLIHFFICEGSNEALLCVCSGQGSNLVLIFLFWGSAFVFHKLSRHTQGHPKDKGIRGEGEGGGWTSSTPSNTSCSLRIYALCNFLFLIFWIKCWVELLHVNVLWVVGVMLPQCFELFLIAVLSGPHP